MAIQFITNFVNGMMAAQQAAAAGTPPGAGPEAHARGQDYEDEEYDDDEPA
jgi:hypothetical protein